jgi:hypothetical protein
MAVVWLAVTRGPIPAFSISLSDWRGNMTARWIFTAMKLTTNSRALWKPLPVHGGGMAGRHPRPYSRF